MKRFAVTTTCGTDIVNLQFNFWRLACRQFDELVEKWRLYARDDGDENDDGYNAEEFVEDAAVVIVLAGASISALLGQNWGGPGVRTPPPLKLLPQYGSSPLWDKFWERYDGIRHFGEPKWEIGNGICETTLEQDMQAAKEIWSAVLQSKKKDVGPEFSRDFLFK